MGDEVLGIEKQMEEMIMYELSYHDFYDGPMMITGASSNEDS